MFKVRFDRSVALYETTYGILLTSYIMQKGSRSEVSQKLQCLRLRI